MEKSLKDFIRSSIIPNPKQPYIFHVARNEKNEILAVAIVSEKDDSYFENKILITKSLFWNIDMTLIEQINEMSDVERDQIIKLAKIKKLKVQLAQLESEIV